MTPQAAFSLFIEKGTLVAYKNKSDRKYFVCRLVLTEEYVRSLDEGRP